MRECPECHNILLVKDKFDHSKVSCIKCGFQADKKKFPVVA